MKSVFRVFFLWFLITHSLDVLAQKQPNVLLIAVDDLKPLLGVYGHDCIYTPNIDKLASQGVVFTNAHCQQAVCGPSRASLLTGMRPDFTRVWDLKTRIRDMNPEIITLPQFLKEHGYTTAAIGKIFDFRTVDRFHDSISWSIPYSESSSFSFTGLGHPPALSFYAGESNRVQVERIQEEGRKLGLTKNYPDLFNFVSKRFKPSVECVDVSDDAYIDGQICNNALKYLSLLSKDEQPFFLSVGFQKPHLPFCAPKKYWDLYQRKDIKLAEYPYAVKNGVDLAYHNSGELLTYTDIPPLTTFSDIFTENLPEEKQRELIHGYYACVSFIDAQVGRLLDHIKELGLDKNTIVVLWGDHGWHLGDHGLWCKHTNFEQATRAPLIVSDFSGNHKLYDGPVEFVDIFPTLCEMLGFSPPKPLQGVSLASLISGSKMPVNKRFAVSQFDRGEIMGYSIRSRRFRLTLWMKAGYRSYMPLDMGMIEAGELYDYEQDPLEKVNYYDVPAYVDIRRKMESLFEEFIKDQNLYNY